MYYWSIVVYQIIQKGATSSGLKQKTFIFSQFLWVKNSGVAWMVVALGLSWSDSQDVN